MTKTSLALDPLALVDGPAAEVIKFLEDTAEIATVERVEIATDVLVDRALRLLRSASRPVLAEESLALETFLGSAPAKRLRSNHPEALAQWAILARLHGEAIRRTDEAAVPSVLAGLGGHAERLVELLVGHGGAANRARLREELGLSESHLSHLLRDLEEVDIVVRYRPAEGKEVRVELGPKGQPLALRLMPPWVDRLVAALAHGGEGEADTRSLSEELYRLGFPSRAAAGKLAEAVVEGRPGEAAALTSGPRPARVGDLLPDTVTESGQPISGFDVFAQVENSPKELREVFAGLLDNLAERGVTVEDFRPATLRNHVMVVFHTRDTAAGHFRLAELAARNPGILERLKILDSDQEICFLFPRASKPRFFENLFASRATR